MRGQESSKENGANICPKHTDGIIFSNPQHKYGSKKNYTEHSAWEYK